MTPGKTDLAEILTLGTNDVGWKISEVEIAVGKNDRNFGVVIFSTRWFGVKSAQIFYNPVDHVMFQIWNLSASCSFHRSVLVQVW